MIGLRAASMHTSPEYAGSCVTCLYVLDISTRLFQIPQEMTDDRVTERTRPPVHDNVL